MNSNKTELLKKIQTLAEQGYNGEAENAKKLLKRLMKKYGIKEIDIIADNLTPHYFKYKTEWDRKLLVQVIFSITGKVPSRITYKNSKKIVIDCSNAQAIEINATFEFYQYYLKQEFELCYDAFLNKNNIFPPNAANADCSSIDPNYLMKLQVMMGAMDKHERRKALPK